MTEVNIMDGYFELSRGDFGDGFYLQRNLRGVERSIANSAGKPVLQYELRVGGYKLGATGFSYEEALKILKKQIVSVYTILERYREELTPQEEARRRELSDLFTAVPANKPEGRIIN
ncbi:hypothetical protein HYX11_04660 [Candidatus Woesearchaeota archaeon]|nr:hypothetical protein [Candidatus Woesearchaeota archaeon]